MAIFTTCRLSNKVELLPVPNSDQPVFTDSADLDGDGSKEEISLYLIKDDINGGKAAVQVGNSIVEIRTDNPEESFRIVDLERSIKGKEIAFTDGGPSGMGTTTFYSYRNNRLSKISSVPGGAESIIIHGNGMISTSVRAQIFDTWFFVQDFLLEEDGFKPISREFYYRPLGNPITTKVQLPLFTEKSTTSETFYVPEGSQVEVVGCDNVSWCKIEFGSRVGWINITESVVNNLNINLDQVFDGLLVAG